MSLGHVESRQHSCWSLDGAVAAAAALFCSAFKRWSLRFAVSRLLRLAVFAEPSSIGHLHPEANAIRVCAASAGCGIAQEEQIIAFTFVADVAQRHVYATFRAVPVNIWYFSKPDATRVSSNATVAFADQQIVLVVPLPAHHAQHVLDVLNKLRCRC